MAVKKNVFLLILLGLISLKVASAAIHIYVHHGGDHQDYEDCELCEHAINNQEFELYSPTAYQQPAAEFRPVFVSQHTFYYSRALKSSLYDDKFCRPPPCFT